MWAKGSLGGWAPRSVVGLQNNFKNINKDDFIFVSLRTGQRMMRKWMTNYLMRKLIMISRLWMMAYVRLFIVVPFFGLFASLCILPCNLLSTSFFWYVSSLATLSCSFKECLRLLSSNSFLELVLKEPK